MPRKVPRLAIWIDASTMFSAEQLNDMLEKWCKELPPAQREALMMRYGILGGERVSETEAALRTGRRQSRVRQIRGTALKKLASLAAKTPGGPFLVSDA